MELKTYHKTIAESWQLFKAFYPPKPNQAYWDELLNAADQIGTQSRFARKMVVVVVNELERIQKSGEAEAKA